MLNLDEPNYDIKNSMVVTWDDQCNADWATTYIARQCRVYNDQAYYYIYNEPSTTTTTTSTTTTTTTSTTTTTTTTSTTTTTTTDGSWQRFASISI